MKDAGKKPNCFFSFTYKEGKESYNLNSNGAKRRRKTKVAMNTGGKKDLFDRSEVIRYYLKKTAKNSDICGSFGKEEKKNNKKKKVKKHV